MPLYRLAIAFALLFIRVLAVFTTAPIVSEIGFPRRFRILGALLVSAVFFPVSVIHVNWFSADIILLVLLGIREFVIGAGIGLILGIIYSSFRLAGAAVGQTMGIAIANVVDPLQDIEVSLVGEFWYFAALAVLVVANGHLYLVEALGESFRLAPVGALAAYSPRGMLMVMVESVGVMFILTGRLLIPVVGIVLLAVFGMGILGRMIPQMHVFIVGFPLMLGVGIIGLYLALPASAVLTDELLGHSTRFWGGWLRSFAAGA
ncbi:MAG: flagellar biosynthetic protein FliR [Planctomycetes bacterium]|nr:flagellar biosynthetic protein FliR [Planctomycetota bacterium]